MHARVEREFLREVREKGEKKRSYEETSCPQGRSVTIDYLRRRRRATTVKLTPFDTDDGEFTSRSNKWIFTRFFLDFDLRDLKKAKKKNNDRTREEFEKHFSTRSDLCNKL